MVGKGKWLIICCIVTGMAVGCASSKKASTEESQELMESLYNPSKLSLHPDFSIFHESNNYSVLYIRAYPSELRFNETNEDAEYRAMLLVKYELIGLDENGGEENAVIDSASIVYKLGEREERSPAFFASLNIPIRHGNRYLVKVETTDLNRGSKGLEYLYVDKTNPNSAQNFKVVSTFSGYPKFMRFFLTGEKFNVQYRDRGVDSIYVNYFRLTSELPRPPITATSDYTMNYVPDTSYVFPMVDTVDYDLRLDGMYHVKVDKEQDEGLTLFNFGGSFPEVKTPRELMEPIFYMATLAEYRDLRTKPNRKLAVDDFWLKLGKSVEKSRELIRIYYNRVIYSNLYFSSNKEGWKTDQGMVFILFGPPNRIQMTGSGESWYFYAKRKSKVVEFKFQREQDAFSDQNMIWQRTTDSQMYLNEAIRSWRNGKVYSMGS
ncbi:MAG: GWxTD domain-containing protein [Bacteroidales bacterium]|nr:GWxTD domain-containing protein [Bacteroidales bacterium]